MAIVALLICTPRKSRLTCSKELLSPIYRWSLGELTEELKEDRPCPLDWQSVKAHVLRENALPPPLHKIKDFVRFYVSQSKGQLDEHATVESI
jgi:hypothetical protein